MIFDDSSGRMRDDMPLLDQSWRRVLQQAADRKTRKLEEEMETVAMSAKQRTAELELCLDYVGLYSRFGGFGSPLPKC